MPTKKHRPVSKSCRPPGRELARLGSFHAGIERLENRRMLAVFTDVSPDLNLALLAGDQVSITSTGNSYILSLGAAHTWSGTDDADVAGNGTNTLTVSGDGIGDFSDAINISDSGSSGGDSAVFADSGSSDYANNFVITLTHSTSGASTPGLAFTGATSFADASTLTAAANGDVIVNSGATLSTASGAISLTATGTNAPITADGNILSSGGSINLQATGSVTVGTGVIVNSGSGTLSLGADLTAAGAGDDGVGTLTVGAGATATSSNISANAITLRGADVNIDTSSNPALVGAIRPSSAMPIATYSAGLSFPTGLAFDSSGNLYVANQSGATVSMFAPGSTTASVTYSTGLSGPTAPTFDSSGNLYVANLGNNTVSKFAPGSTTPIATYSADLSSPRALAFDSSGNLYVANLGNNTVSKFAPGSTTASATYSTGLSEPIALAFDASGNLYVANYFNSTVSKFAPGSTTPSATYSTGVSLPWALAFDSSGNLYVANAGGSTVSKFAPGSTTPSATYSAGLSSPDALAFDTSGNLYVANSNNATVSEFAPGSTTPIVTYSAGVVRPAALAFDTSGNLYVANLGDSAHLSDNTVSEFAPVSTKSTPTAGGVVIQSSVESRPMQIGGTNSAVVAGINLTTAELAQVFTTSIGTVTIGDSQQTGSITFSIATPATTAGAALGVLQSTAGAGQIILDDAAGSGTGLNGNGGKVTLTPGAGGIQTALFATGTPLVTSGFTANGTALNLALGFAPTLGTQLTIINNTATPAAGNSIGGTFSNLPQGGIYKATFAGATYNLQANYQGGDGNDLVLTSVPEIGPIVAIMAVTPSPRNSAVGSMTITFSEPVTGVALSNLQLSRSGGANLLTGSQTLTTSDDTTWALGNLTALTGIGGTYVLTLSPTGVKDTAGNALASGATSSFIVDTVAPTATIAAVTPNPRNSAVGSMTVTFSEPVSGFTLSNLQLSVNGGANLLTGSQTLTTSDNTTWTLGNLTGITSSSGPYVLMLSPAGVKDAAGNDLANGATSSFTVSTVAPTVAVTAVTPNPRNSAVGSMTITFSEPVSGFALSNLQLSRNGGGNLLTGSQTLATSDNTTWTLGNLAGLTGVSGSYVLSVSATGVKDTVGNALVSGATSGFTVSTVAPTVTITAVNPNPRNAAVGSMTVTFSEPVSGLMLSNLQLTRNGGGNLLTGSQTLTTSDNTIWNLGNLVGLTSTSGNYQLTLSPTGIMDAVGNAMISGASSNFAVTPPRQNKTNPLDVNSDGSVTPIDALIVINYLNSQKTGTADLDVNGDGLVTALDALVVINYLNSPANGSPAASATNSAIAPSGENTVAPAIDGSLTMGVSLSTNSQPAVLGSKTPATLAAIALHVASTSVSPPSGGSQNQVAANLPLTTGSGHKSEPASRTDAIDAVLSDPRLEWWD